MLVFCHFSKAIVQTMAAQTAYVLKEGHNILIVENVINRYQAAGPNAEPKGEYQCNCIHKSMPFHIPYIFQHILILQD